MLPRPVHPNPAGAGGLSLSAPASVVSAGDVMTATALSGSVEGGSGQPPAVWVRSSDPNVQCGYAHGGSNP